MPFDYNTIDFENFAAEEQARLQSQTPEMLQQEQEEELGFWGTVGDIGKGIGRGFLGAVENTIEVGNIIPGVNYDIYETDDIIDPTESFAGSAIETLVQFTAGFAAPGVGGLAWAGRLGKLTGLASRGGLHAGKFAKAAVKAQNADRKLTALALARGGEAIKYMGAGAVADFTVFDAHEQRLSNLLQEFPALQNPFFEWMAADESDSEFEGRLKNMIEGIGLGFAIDGLMIGFRAIKSGSKLDIRGKKQDDVTMDAAAKGFEDVVARDAADDATKALTKEADEVAEGVVKDADEVVDDVVVKEVDEVPDADLTPIERLSRIEDPDELYAAIDKLSIDELEGIQKTFSDSPLDEATDIVNAHRISVKTAVALQRKNKVPVSHAVQLSEAAKAQEFLEESGKIARGSKSEVTDVENLAREDAEQIREISMNRVAIVETSLRFLGKTYEAAKSFADPNSTKMDRAGAIRYLKSKTDAQRIDIAHGRVSGEMGRALNLHHASNTKLPRTLTVDELEQVLKDTKQVDDIIEANGGLAAIQKDARLFMMAYDVNPAKALKVHSQKGGFGKSVIEYWMNAILSGPTTQAVNALSGVLTTTISPLEKAIGRAITGDMSGAAQQLKRYVYLAQSIDDALGQGWKAFCENKAQLDELTSSTGERGYSQSVITHTMIEKRMLESTVGVEAAHFIAKALGNVVTAPSRSLMAVDEVFKQLNYRSSMKAGLAEKAIADGITNPRLIAEFVDTEFNRIVDDGQFYTRQKVYKQALEMSDAQLLAGLERQKNPILKDIGETAEPGGSLAKEDGSFNRVAAQSHYIDWEMANISPLADQALKHARDMTFTTPLSRDRGTFISISKDISNASNNNPLVRLVVPFVRTPANIIQHVIDRTPLGALSFSNREGFNILRKELFSADPTVKADAIGRLMTGSALLTSGYMLALQGKITGGGPSDRNKRKVLEDSGWKPYSVKIGDTYTSFRRLDPYSSFFGIMADVADIYANGDETTRDETEAAGMALLVAMAKNLTDKTYLTGMTRVSNALSNPDRFMGSWARSTVGSFVPNVLTQANRSIDDEHKDIRTMLDTIKSRLPFYSKDAPPRRNLFGEVVTKQGALGPDFISPFDYSETTSDVLKKELAQIGHGFSSPRSEKNGVELRAYMNDSGQSAYDRWLELHGSVKLNGKTFRQAMTRLLKSRDYKKLPYEAVEGLENSPRVREINKILSKYRAKAFSQMLREFPDVRQRDEINLLIKQARRTGRSYEELLALTNQ